VVDAYDHDPSHFQSKSASSQNMPKTSNETTPGNDEKQENNGALYDWESGDRREAAPRTSDHYEYPRAEGRRHSIDHAPDPYDLSRMSNRQASPLRQRPGSPQKAFPNGKLARQRVFVLPNDGGTQARHSKPQHVFYNDSRSLLEEATVKLQLPWAARRLFTQGGLELFSLRAIKPEDTLVVSVGEDFKPRPDGRPTSTSRSRARAAGRSPSRRESHGESRIQADLSIPTPDFPSDTRESSPSRTRGGLRRVKRVSVRCNDGGTAPDRAVVEASTMQGFLDAAAIQLGLACPLRRFFTLDGLEIFSMDEIKPNAELVASAGENFRQRRAGSPAPQRRSGSQRRAASPTPQRRAASPAPSRPQSKGKRLPSPARARPHSPSRSGSASKTRPAGNDELERLRQQVIAQQEELKRTKAMLQEQEDQFGKVHRFPGQSK